MDAGQPFVSRTYLLEGDGELATQAYDYLQEVSIACALQNYPLTAALVHQMADGDAALEQNLMSQAKQCVRPAIDYFRLRFNHTALLATSGSATSKLVNFGKSLCASLK